MKALLLEAFSRIDSSRIRRLQRGLLFVACLAGTLLRCEPVNAQWSVSAFAESTLYVCPGFYPGLISFSDGGCIVVGVLRSYIFAGKLAQVRQLEDMFDRLALEVRDCGKQSTLLFERAM